MVPCRMQVDFLPPKLQSAATCAKCDGRHPKNFGVKINRSLNVLHGQDKVIEVGYLHFEHLHKFLGVADLVMFMHPPYFE
jgi:hypothetical protein